MARPDKYLSADGKRLPSVTELIGELGWNKEVLMRWADKLAREGKSPIMERDAAARRGSMVHALIEGDGVADGEYTSRDADEAYRAWLMWRQTVSIETLWQEEPLVSDAAGFAGTPDLIGSIDGVVHVLDWKTASKPGKPYLEHVIQATAYAALWNEREALLGNARFATHATIVKLAPHDDVWRATPFSWRLDAFGHVPTWIMTACINLRRAREAMQLRASELW